MRLSSAAFFFGSAAAVVLVGALAALVTWVFHPTTKPPCTLNCAPPRPYAQLDSALPDAGSYSSPKLGWVLIFPKGWKVEDTSGDKVLFQTRAGLLKVVATKDNPGFAALVSKEVQALNSAVLPDLSLVGPIRGAHIGTQQGQGQLYKATFYPASGGGRGTLVRIGIEVATRRGVTVVCTALAPYDQSSGRMLAQDIDYALTEFRWAGE
jgi:hypothetical protein